MVHFIKEKLKMINLMVKENIFGKKEDIIMEIGLMEKLKEREFLLIQMDLIMKGNFIKD